MNYKSYGERGVSIILSNSNSVFIKCMLLAVSCDLPAGRKVCGFLSHAAKLGCSRCYMTNNSDFNKKKWKIRENKKHRADVNSFGKSKNITERAKNEKKLGCRYSVLLELYTLF